MIWIIWMSRQVAKKVQQLFCKWSELCGWSSQLQRAFSVLLPFFLAHRTKLVGCVRTAEEGWNIDISKNIWWHSVAGLCEWSRQETQPSHTIFPVKSQKVVASIFKVWTGLTCEGSSCRVWVIDRWQKLEIDQSIFLFFKVLIVPLQTPWDGCYMKQILSKGLPWEGSTYLIRWSTIKTPPSFKMNQKHQSPWTVLAHILKIWADLNSTVTKISSTSRFYS